MLMTMCFQFSMLNIYHAYGCHLKGKAITHRVVCYSVGPLYINNMQPSFNSLFLKNHSVQDNSYYLLGLALLCTTSHHQLFFSLFSCSHMVFHVPMFQ